MLNVEVYKRIFIPDFTILKSVYLVVHTGYMHVAIKLINSINIQKKEDFLEQYKTTMTGILKRHSKIYFSFVFIQTKRSLEDVKQSNSINQSMPTSFQPNCEVNESLCAYTSTSTYVDKSSLILVSSL